MSSCPLTNLLVRGKRTLDPCSGQPSPTRMLNPNEVLLDLALDMHWDGSRSKEDTGGPTMDAGGPTGDAGGPIGEAGGLTGGIEKVIHESEM